VITATLSGDDMCEADGFTAVGYAPALDLCRLLVAAGRDFSSPMRVFRDGVLSLRIRSIGEGAALCVEDDKIGRPRFAQRRLRSTGTAPHINQTAGVAISPPAASQTAP
jgi:hypothetical protein